MTGHATAFRWATDAPDWSPLSDRDAHLPPDLNPDSLRSEKPQMRKFNGALFVAFPVRKATTGEPSAWHLWVLPNVPDLAALPSRIEELRQVSQTLERALVQQFPVQAPNDPSGLTELDRLLERTEPFGRPKRKALLKAIAETIVEAGVADAAAVMVMPEGNRKPPSRQIAFSARNLTTYRDEYRHLAKSRRKFDQQVSETLDRTSDWEITSFAEMQAQETVALHLPSQQTAGIGFILTNPTSPDSLSVHLERFSKLYAMITNTKWRKENSTKKVIMRSITFVAIALVMTWLIMPAPIRITATVLTEPVDSIVEALPEDATLREILVQAGDTVAPGERIAVFTSSGLDEQVTDAELRVAIEQLTSQAALSENDYGAYAISEKQIELETKRLQQLEQRRNDLVLTSQVSARVISALSTAERGAFLGVGTEVARLQPENTYQITLDLASLDAPTIKPGQTGTVWFRGMSGEEFNFEVTQPAIYILDPTTDIRRLVARGVLTAGPQDRLIIGLSGFSKVKIGEAPRFVVFSRYLTEYIREKIWIYMNIQI